MADIKTVVTGLKNAIDKSESPDKTGATVHKAIDGDGSGGVSKEELKKEIQAGTYTEGVCVKDDVVDQLFVEMDANQDGYVSVEEFKNFISAWENN